MEAVTLVVSGNSCTISNGILTMVWKEDGTLGSLVRNGVELVCNLPGRSDTEGLSAFYVDYHAEGAFRRCAAQSLQVISHTAQMAHIAYTDQSGYLAISYHIILMEGESGYYSYVIGANNTDVAFELAEFRIVYRCGSRIFDHACTAERHGLQPTHKYMEQYEKVQDETFRLPDGEKYTNGDVYSKYDYAGYFSRNPAWGQYGHGYGFFVIPVSTEYYPGGPMKQELLVHYDGIVLNYFTGSHFGTGNLHVPVGWSKIYGPFYQYFNEGNDPDVLYRDACRVATREQEKWPYSWVQESLYPLVRSTVTGRLLFADGRPCTQTTVILGQGDTPPERQSEGYLFYTHTDGEGYFTLKNVRFGSYCLFAYQTGGSNTEQLQTDYLEIQEVSCSLGTLVWKLPEERVLWQLGKATRTCEGYRYGGELRNYKWMNLVPERVDFTIGKDKEATDWYYAQTRPGAWFLHFDLTDIPKNPCRLIVAIAGASHRDTVWGTADKVSVTGNTSASGQASESDKASSPDTVSSSNSTSSSNQRVAAGNASLVGKSSSLSGGSLPSLTVSLNGRTLGTSVLVNDNSIYRSATLSGRYRRLVFSVDPAGLCKGENVIALQNHGARIMYDTILLAEIS